jgi:hypothetical protein
MAKRFNATTGTQFVGASISLGDRSTADTVEFERVDNTSGTNGAVVSRYAGTRDPNGAVTATAGSVYHRSNGTLYVNIDGATAWAGIGGTALATVPTIQNVAVAGPTAITNTMHTHVRVNVGAAATVTLPAAVVGKRVSVKDASALAATNNITVDGATIDGVLTYVINTNRGSVSMICVSAGPDIWDVV